MLKKMITVLLGVRIFRSAFILTFLQLNHPTKMSDLCQCSLKSSSGSVLPIYCLADARNHMFVQYGPTWWLPLQGVKKMDSPYWLLKNRNHRWTKSAAKSLRRMRKTKSPMIVSGDLPFAVPSYADEALVLAQLNLCLYVMFERTCRSMA